jgi:hypothetical protein
MTHRDLKWRACGVAAFSAACAIGAIIGPDAASTPGLFCFALALAGAVLIIQGKRVAAVFRIERSRHRALAQSIHDRRRRRAGS